MRAIGFINFFKSPAPLKKCCFEKDGFKVLIFL